MIRRWSCLISINLDTYSFTTFNKILRKKIFRSSVRFKRYRFKGTKFKRRHLRKIKHNTLWPLYYDVFKYWTQAIRFSKQQARYQYYYKFFVNNCTAVVGNPRASQLNKVYVWQDEWVVASITRKMYISYGMGNNSQVINSHKYLYHTAAFFPSDEISGDAGTLPALAFFDKQFFIKSYENELSNFDIFVEDNIFETILLQQHREIYKILTILWFKIL